MIFKSYFTSSCIFFSVNCSHSCFNKIFIVLNLCTSFFKWCLILLLNWPILLWFYPFLHILASLLFREDLSLFFRINLMLYSCSFCLSEEFFVSHSILSDNLNGESILGCKLSPFRTLNIYCKIYILVCKFSVEKSTCGDSLVTDSLFFFSLLLNPL